VRGERIVVRSPTSLRRPVRMLHPRLPLYIVPRGNGLFMIGATMIESERRGPVSVRSALELLNAAYALHPAFGEAEIVELGADLRPAFPDNLPSRVKRPWCMPTAFSGTVSLAPELRPWRLGRPVPASIGDQSWIFSTTMHDLDSATLLQRP
jgi:hypothetical protein